MGGSLRTRSGLVPGTIRDCHVPRQPAADRRASWCLRRDGEARQTVCCLRFRVHARATAPGA
jgi:hypothetical protein